MKSDARERAAARAAINELPPKGTVVMSWGRKSVCLFSACVAFVMVIGAFSAASALGCNDPTEPAAPPPQPAPHALTYKDGSAGMNSIEMEIGHTILKGADMNKDGATDILCVGDHGNPHVNTQENGLMIWFNGGTGDSWTLWQDQGGYGYGGVSVGDINNDGSWDVAFGVHHNYAGTGLGSKLLEAATGSSTGKSWSRYSTGLATLNETYGMFATQLGDWNNDGWLDLLAGSFGYGNGYKVYTNMHGSWSGKDLGSISNVDNEADMGDFNNDGNLDLLTAYDDGASWFGDGAGNFAAQSAGLTLMRGEGLGVGDVTGDGADDFVYVPATLPLVYSWDGGQSKWVSAIKSGVNPTDAFELAALGDMNNDGRVDVVGAGYSNIYVWTNQGGGIFKEEAKIPCVGEPNAICIPGDLDHNGYLDIATLNRNSTTDTNTMYVFLEGSAPPSASVNVLYPSGWQKFTPGQANFIKWTTAIPAGGPGGSASIELSTDGKGGPWTPVGSKADGGMYQWTIPNTPSKNCYIKITASGASGTNAYPFEIIGSSGPTPVAVNLISPAGGENWTVGMSHDITWTAAGGSGGITIGLEYSTTGASGPWTSIAAGLANSGLYSWTPTSVPASKDCYVRVTATSGGATETDMNGTPFEIYADPVPPTFVLGWVTVTPKTATLDISQTLGINAIVYDENGTDITAQVTVGWTTAGGIGSVSPASGASTIFTASASGSGTVKVTAYQTGKNVFNTTAITVNGTAPPPPNNTRVIHHVTITPASIPSIQVNGTRGMSAAAYDQNGTAFSSGVTYAWSVVGGRGTVSPATGASATFTATAAGTDSIKVQATFNGTTVENTSAVTITAPPPPDAVINRVDISPAGIAGKIGDTETISAAAYDSDGNDITAACTLAWSVSPVIATISDSAASSTMLTLTTEGTAVLNISATYMSKTVYDEISVAVSTPGKVLGKVTLSRASFTGNVGEKVTITAVAYDTGNSAITSGVTYLWSVTKSGVASLSSTSTASVTLTLNAAGTVTVTVTATYAGDTKTASMTATAREAASGIPMVAVIGIVVALVVVIAIIALLMMKRKGRKKDNNPFGQPGAQGQYVPPAQGYPQQYPPQQGGYPPAQQYGQQGGYPQQDSYGQYPQQ